MALGGPAMPPSATVRWARTLVLLASALVALRTAQRAAELAAGYGSLGSILGGGEGGGGIFGSGNTPFGLNGFFLDSDSSSSSSFSDFNALFGSRPRTTTPSPLGDFSELSGGPWTQ